MKIKPVVLKDPAVLHTVFTILRAIRLQVLTASTTPWIAELSSSEQKQAIAYLEKIRCSCGRLLLSISENNNLSKSALEANFSEIDFVALFRCDIGSQLEYDQIEVTFHADRVHVCGDIEIARNFIEIVDLLKDQINVCARTVWAESISKRSRQNFLMGLAALLTDVEALRVGVYFDHPQIITDEFWKTLVADIRSSI